MASEIDSLDSPSLWLRISRAIEGVLRPLEQVAYYGFTRPVSRLLDLLDPLSRKLEGTRTRKVLQIVIFPLFMALTLVLGFYLVENGFTSRSFLGTVVMFLIMGAIFAPLERLIPFSRNWLRSPDGATDVMVFLSGTLWTNYINQPIRIATIVILVEQISPTIGQSIWPASLNPLVQVFLLLSINDFFRYWYHRWMHESPFMWRWHAVHHSSERLYWFNGTRAHPIEYLVSSFLWAIPLAFVQAPVEIVFVAWLLGRTIGRFQHTNMDLILGPLDYVFSSPKNHRYHHSRKLEEGNSNYGGDVIFWDILFGTFHLPKGQEPGDDIGLDNMPNYPKTFAGLMLAPFTHGALRREARELHATVDLPADGTEHLARSQR